MGGGEGGGAGLKTEQLLGRPYNPGCEGTWGWFIGRQLPLLMMANRGRDMLSHAAVLYSVNIGTKIFLYIKQHQNIKCLMATETHDKEKHARNPLPAQTRRLPQVTWYCFFWGGDLLLPLPSDLVHVQFICLFPYRWTVVYMNSFYPVTGLLMKWTDVTRTAHYPLTFGTSL